MQKTTGNSSTTSISHSAIHSNSAIGFGLEVEKEKKCYDYYCMMGYTNILLLQSLDKY